MLVTERPGIFLGKAYNQESWYVVDTTYSAFHDQVVTEWRAQHRRTNRPWWIRVVTSVGVPLVFAAIMALTVVKVPVSEWGLAIVVGSVFCGVLWLTINRVSDHFWPSQPKTREHLHSVVPINPSIAEAATDHTLWPELWEVSQAIFRGQQAFALVAQLDEYLETLHAPEERQVVTQARDALVLLSDQRDAEFDEVARRSNLFVPPSRVDPDR